MAISKRTKTRILFGLFTGLLTSFGLYCFDLYSNNPAGFNKYLFLFISLFVINSTIVGYFAVKRVTK